MAGAVSNPPFKQSATPHCSGYTGSARRTLARRVERVKDCRWRRTEALLQYLTNTGDKIMRILLIDDHGLFRAGLEQLLRALNTELAIASVNSFFALEKQVQTLGQFDLVLLDYHIPGDDPLLNIAKARGLFPRSKLVLISAETDCAIILTAIEHGASGFIPKRAEPDVLIVALKLVLAGGVYLPAEIAAYLQAQQPPPAVAHYSSRAKIDPPNPSSECAETLSPAIALSDLSRRQKQVLQLAINGLSNQQIGEELSISIDTVKAHLSNIYRTLGIHSRTQAVLLCHTNGGLE